MPEPPLGVVLAGGPGRRLGGGKPWRTVAGRRLIDLAVEKLAAACPRVAVVCAEVAAMADLTVEVLADRWPGQGPLGGLATAFLDTGAASVLLLAVDAPLVQPALLARLAQGDGRMRAVAPLGPLGPEPLLAWYSRDVLGQALGLLKGGQPRMKRLLGRHCTRFIGPAELAQLDPQGLSFINVNRPEDLALARRLMGECVKTDTSIAESVADGTQQPSAKSGPR
ncbi:molybdenum cofactor guanylyltransferase [Desulfarculus baarsii DSM 2075]|uniref:Probable molybdenum cofactor guanylyltransferase n=1 Tax=Desulfarculus baarsii (strain ATCC 33931 / DSM 2075 / LMG 7858 / VKM B-1802 / 2st14) TaxID=644282 RepID=E1QEQ1_DESB2|nr:molybdenum cofactor guanylyltransferase [Desulfarculus baarsii]ADK84037.1 molybdenum cofactor guanylyltransferase [Desulfarculus baarsii DSM 2075]